MEYVIVRTTQTRGDQRPATERWKKRVVSIDSTHLFVYIIPSLKEAMQRRKRTQTVIFATIYSLTEKVHSIVG